MIARGVRGIHRLLRRLARLLVRGPWAEQVLADLDEAYGRDRARGMGFWRAGRRWAVNLLASAWSVWRSGSGPGLVSLLDVKMGWRMLWKHPLLTGVSVASLAIGIPVGFAPSHAWDAMEAPLPVAEGHRVVGLRHRSVEGGGAAPTTVDDLAIWRESLTTFEALAAYRPVRQNLTVGSEGPGTPVDGAFVTASTFSVLRVPPLFGRTLVPSDEADGAPVAVIGEELWRTRLAADPDPVGRVVRVGGVPHTVVGVMPAGFRFPARERLWLPLRDRPGGEAGRGAPVLAFGRLAEGATEDAAQREVEDVERRVASAIPGRERRRAEVLAFSSLVAGRSKGGIRAGHDVWLTDLVALLLLAVACANVGLLIFARTATRAQELSVRAALGASRGRIVGQVFVEALVLAGVAAGLGLLVLAWLPSLVMEVLWAPDGGMPWWFDFGLRPVTVVRALVLAVASAGLAATLPALRLTGRTGSAGLQRPGAGGWGVRFGHLSSVLIVADVAVAIAVVGVCLAAADRVRDIASGRADALPTHEYLAVRLELPEDVGVASDSAARALRRDALHRDFVERLALEPGVLGVATADVLPRMNHPGGVVEVEGVPGTDHPAGGHDVERVRVVPGYFEALGVPVLAGRAFGAADLEGDRSAVLVDAHFVDRVLGGRNPLGRRLRYVPWGPRTSLGPWHEIVGVVPALGTKVTNPGDAEGVYHAAAPRELDPFHFAVHTAGDPMELAPRVRAVAAEVEPAALLAPPVSLDDLDPGGWLGMVAFVAGWSVFAGVLLALAASGIYAIMSFAVAQRRREIGIRGALGAGRREIAATVGRRAAVQLGLGALVGMPLAGRLYFVLLDDPSATVGAFLAGVVPGVAVLLFVGLAACSVPTLRALRVTPTEAMRGAD